MDTLPPHPLFLPVAACMHSLLGLGLQTVFKNRTVPHQSTHEAGLLSGH